MYLPLFNDLERVFSGIPLGISYMKKIQKNFLEFGFSASAISDTYFARTTDIFGNKGVSSYHIEDLVLMGSIRLGIRHQPVDKRIFWNALSQFSFIVVSDQNNFKIPFEVSTTPLLSFGVGYSL